MSLKGGLPGPGQVSPVSTKAAGAVDRGGWIEPLIKAVPLAEVRSAGSSLTSVSVAARIVNPAARLVCAFSIGFEPKSIARVSSFTSSVWSAAAFRLGPSGREGQLHSIFVSRSLPEMWEVASGVRIIEVTATLKIPTDAAVATMPGDWVLQVEWEPAMPMCADEVAALYSRCVANRTLSPAGILVP